MIKHSTENDRSKVVNVRKNVALCGKSGGTQNGFGKQVPIAPNAVATVNSQICSSVSSPVLMVDKVNGHTIEIKMCNGVPIRIVKKIDKIPTCINRRRTSVKANNTSCTKPIEKTKNGEGIGINSTGATKPIETTKSSVVLPVLPKNKTEYAPKKTSNIKTSKNRSYPDILMEIKMAKQNAHQNIILHNKNGRVKTKKIFRQDNIFTYPENDITGVLQEKYEAKIKEIELSTGRKVKII
jgi:hypothetical protein